VTYWKVLGSSGSNANCTDGGDWEEVVGGPKFSDGSYFMYRVESGSDLATGQDCESLDPSTCVDSDLEWVINGHTLTYEPEVDTLDLTGDCDLLFTAVWTIMDEGESGLFSLEMSFDYTGDSSVCDALEADIVAASTNGFGLDDCVVTLDADLEMSQIK